MVSTAPTRIDFQPATTVDFAGIADAPWQTPRTRVTKLRATTIIVQPEGADEQPCSPDPKIDMAHVACGANRAALPDDKSEGTADKTARRAAVVCDHRFHAPAQFPLPSFSPFAERFEDSGILIYEGMQFKVFASGLYQVRYTVETPALPVTIRMQMIVSRRDSLHTLTLPPVAIPSGTDRKRAAQSVYEVCQEGFLPAFASAERNTLCVVRRQGAARIGFGLDVP
jgi:hypothetical protein